MNESKYAPIAAKSLNIFESLLNPANALAVYMSALGIVYGLVPLIIAIFLPNSEMFWRLTIITFVSLISMWLGSRIPLLDQRFSRTAFRFGWSSKKFIFLVWSSFLIFLLVTFATAQSIPILSALRGATSDDLSFQRGAFLKGREGAGFVLQYISSFLVNTVVPYSIVLLYERGDAKRHLATSIFFLFCISFMQKALFLNLILPLLAFLAIKRRLHGRTFITVLIGSVALLFATTFLSLRGEENAESSNDTDYLSASYLASSPLDYLVWRSFAVPIFTATDTLVVHEQFGSHPLMGATSSFIASVFGLERMNIERYVFEYQFGGWNDIANANAVFMIDAFINFDWIGVCFFGLFVGLIFRWFRLSQDVAFKSLWPLFAFILFSAPLIGMLLSNGFAYMLFHALFIRIKKI